MLVELAFDEVTPMMIDVPVRHADSDEDSDDEALPSIVVAALENLSVLFSDLRLNDGPRYFREDFDQALSAPGEPAAFDTLPGAITGLKTPVTTSADPAEARASLEEARKRILEEGIAVASAKRRLEATRREYNFAYGLTPIFEAPSRLGSVRSHGQFIAEVLGGDLPTYETPAANMRAAQAAMEQMASLEGEERAFQEKRVKDLLDAANQQHTRFDPG
ncbi:hypothetical protein ZWY2020_050113 [Hordeum vulgare]|nr:hypothetical protein ZWY2020_050113 [Hordeum vulgare]